MHFAMVLAALVLVGGRDNGHLPPTPATELARIARAYRIEIVTTDPGFPVQAGFWHKIDGKRADDSDIAAFAGLIGRELSLYPPELLKRIGLKRIVLCKELRSGRQSVGGLTDWEHNTIYFDLLVYRRADQRYPAELFHHELFHVIDYGSGRKETDDERWAALNPDGFKYGRGGNSAQNYAGSGVLTDEFPGFLNHYSTTEVSEDKAEVFGNLVVNRAYVERLIKTDAVVQAKVKRIRELIAGICPEASDAFWEKTQTVARMAPEFRKARKISPVNSILYVGP